MNTGDVSRFFYTWFLPRDTRRMPRQKLKEFLETLNPRKETQVQLRLKILLWWFYDEKDHHFLAISIEQYVRRTMFLNYEYNSNVDVIRNKVISIL